MWKSQGLHRGDGQRHPIEHAPHRAEGAPIVVALRSNRRVRDVHSAGVIPIGDHDVYTRVQRKPGPVIGVIDLAKVAPERDPDEGRTALIETGLERTGIAQTVKDLAIEAEIRQRPDERFSIHTVIGRVAPRAADVAAIAPVWI